MKTYINLKLLLSFSIFLLKIFIVHPECGRETPIYASYECQMKYCTKSQFDSGECRIDNSIVKTQWLNDIILLDSDRFRYGSFTINSKGDLIYESSVEGSSKRIFYWIKKDGSFHFKNENGESIPAKIINVQNGDNNMATRYESQIITVLDNNNKEYLLSISLWEGSVEYYNLENMDYSFFQAMEFTKYDIHSYLGNLYRNDNSRDYLHTFIGQNNYDRGHANFFIITQQYSFYNNILSLNNGYSVNEKIKKQIDTGAISRIVSNFKMSWNLYILLYLNKNYGNYEFIIELYDNNFQSKNSLTIGNIEGDYSSYRYDGVFHKGIYLKNNIAAFIYYKSNTNYSPRIRLYKINAYSFTEFYDYTLYTPGELHTGAIFNNMIKISDKRFSFISSSNDRKKLYIFLFDFYDNDRKIKERIYKINLFDLYHYKIYRELTTISFNNFLTLSASACNTETCEDSSNYFSFIIIFGYINGTQTNINISNFLSEFNDINNNENIIDALLGNIKIDNNIFGYEFKKQIKLITIPDELNFYNIEDGVKSKVNEGGILEYNYEISQSNNVKMGNKTYNFEFQYISKEPDINKFNSYAINSDTVRNCINCDSGTPSSEENFESQTFYGKTMKIEFKLCYELCDTCEKLGISYDDQQCLTCTDNLISYNGNCYPEGYITEVVTEPITELTTEIKTEYMTEPITELTTEIKTEYMTEPITELTTEIKTEYMTEPITELTTEIKTEYTTEIVTDYITQTGTEFTDYTTDYITQINTEYAREYLTDYFTDFIIESQTKIDLINFETYIVCQSKFYSKDNNECLESCSYSDLLNNNCGITDTENKNSIIYNLIKENILQNYTGENVVIEAEDDYVFQLTSSINEKDAKDGKGSNNYNLSMIDLGDCEEKLKRENGIKEEDSLIIYKLEKVGTIASQKNIQYEVYNPDNLQKLDLSICENEKINIYIPITLSEDTLELHKDLLSYGYDLFNPNDSFYQDVCTEYTSANGTDVLLSDRRAYFFNDTETACQKGCTYSEYSAETKHLKCECDAKEETIEPEPEKSGKFDGSIIFTSFYDVLKVSNFLVLKCYKLVFSYKGEYHNWGSCIFIVYFTLYSIFNIMYFVKGFFYAKLYSARMIFNNNILDDNNRNTKRKKAIKRKKRRSKSLYVGNPPRKKKSNIIRNTRKINERKDSSKRKIFLKIVVKDSPNSKSSAKMEPYQFIENNENIEYNEYNENNDYNENNNNNNIINENNIINDNNEYNGYNQIYYADMAKYYNCFLNNQNNNINGGNQFDKINQINENNKMAYEAMAKNYQLYMNNENNQIDKINQINENNKIYYEAMVRNYQLYMNNGNNQINQINGNNYIMTNEEMANNYLFKNNRNNKINKNNKNNQINENNKITNEAMNKNYNIFMNNENNQNNKINKKNQINEKNVNNENKIINEKNTINEKYKNNKKNTINSRKTTYKKNTINKKNTFNSNYSINSNNTLNENKTLNSQNTLNEKKIFISKNTFNEKNEDNENNDINRQITEKNIPVIGRNLIQSKKKKQTLLKRKNSSKKRQTYSSSCSKLNRFENKINYVSNKEDDNKDIFNDKNNKVNNENNKNSIEIYNHQNPDSKDLILNKNPKKKNLISYFQANNFDDFELNELPYEKAVDYDHRSFFYFYWQLLRREHLIFFTFFSWGDNNILAIKLSKCVFAMALDFAINVVFFVDDSMHKIYVNYGKYNFIAQIPQILYSTIAAEALDVFLRYLCIIEKDVYKIKKFEQKKDKVIAKQQIFQVLKCMRIKLMFYFIVTFLFMCFFWYFVATFCAVYKNTQIFLIKDSMVSLLMSLLYPFGLYLLPTALRIISLRDKKKRLSCLYKLSDIIPLI